MSIEKKVANKVLSDLDASAKKIIEFKIAGKLDPRLADTLVREIDTFADKFEIKAFGQKSFDARRAKLAKVLQKDKDEGFMDTFDNPNKVIESDKDEPYMHSIPPSARLDGVKTFDQDMTTTVSDRDEYGVNGLSEYAEPTKKQPSWTGGPKKSKASVASKPKTWAP